MQIKVKITDVYDGEEYPRDEVLAVTAPPTRRQAVNGWEVEIDEDYLDEWADAQIQPHTGTSQEHEESGYFAQILECEDFPTLVGREFEWGT